MKRKLRNALAILLAAAMVFALGACATEVDESGENLSKVWRSTHSGDPVTLNPLNYSASADADMMGWIYGGLLERDTLTNTWTYIGAHAEDYPEISEDGLTWTFKIREGLTWSDGTPINAHTYEYTVKMLLDPLLANRNAYVLWDNVVVKNAEAYALGDLAEESGFESVTWEDVGCKAIDDYTLVYELEVRPLTIVGVQALSRVPIHPELFEACMNEDRTENTYGTSDFLSQPTCGPYKLVQYVAGQFIAYEKDYSYVLADHYVRERLEYRFVNQQTVREQLFESGQIDNITVTSSNYDKYAEDPSVVKGTGGQPWHVYVNMTSETNPILQDKDFRQALFYSAARAEVAEGVFKVFKPAAYFVKTDAFIGDPSGETYSYRSTPEAIAITPENDGYNPELALELFNKAYEANGSQKITLKLTYFDNDDTWTLMCAALQEGWMGLFGADRLEIELTAMNFNQAYDSYKNGDYDLGVGSVSQSSPNPWSSMNQWTSTWAGKNDQMSDPEFDELVKRTNTGDLLHASYEEKTIALARMEEILIDTVPAIPIMQNTNWAIYSDRTTLLSPDWAPGIGWIVSDLEPIAISTVADIAQ